MDEYDQPINGAVVKLYSAKTVKAFTATDSSGSFHFENLEAGTYELYASYLGYSEYKKGISVSTAAATFYNVILTQATQKLKGITVVGRAVGVTQKDDTLEYNSTAYKLSADANAADLLRKLPLMQVSDRGVTALGEMVTNVLVDGKPFFNKNPNTALSILPAEVIDKVQVFNGKSEQEQFTGFSEGPRQKTINIVTKPGKRHGTFGTASGGYGVQQHKASEETSANTDDAKYGAAGTVNTLDGERRLTLTAQSNNINVPIFSGQAPFASGAGIITNKNAGINYTDKWGKKADVTIGLQSDGSNKIGSREIKRIYTLPGWDQSYSEVNNTGVKDQNYSAQSRINYQIDKQNSLIWQPQYSWHKNILDFQNAGITNSNADLIARSSNASISEGVSSSISNDLLFRHLFKKAKRTLSFNSSLQYSRNNGSGSQNTHNRFYKATIVDDSFSQISNSRQNTQTMFGNVTYTEPIGSAGLVKVEYNISSLTNDADKEVNSYADTANGAYDIPSSLLSNAFDSKNTTQKAGFSYLLSSGKNEVSLGAFYQHILLNNTSRSYPDNNFRQFYSNFLPVATYRHKFSFTKSVQVSYSTSSRIPNVLELQRVVDNTDPLHLYTGNPTLKQAYAHSMNLRYNTTLKDFAHTFSVFLSGNATQNFITRYSIIALTDTIIHKISLPTGAQLIMPINLGGQWDVSGNISYSFSIPSIKCGLNVSIDASINQMPVFINTQLNYQNTRSAGIVLSISSNINPKIDFFVTSNSSLTSSANSIDRKNNTTYLSQAGNLSLKLVLPQKVTFNTSMLCQLNFGLSEGFNQNYFLWNLSIGKKLLKKDNMEIRLSVFDVLNKNKNVKRTITETYVQDMATSTMQQYLMLVFNYTFSRFKS